MFSNARKVQDMTVFKIDLFDLQTAYQIAKENGGNTCKTLWEIEQEINFLPQSVNFHVEESKPNLQPSSMLVISPYFHPTQCSLLHLIAHTNLSPNSLAQVGLTEVQRQTVLNNLVNRAKLVRPDREIIRTIRY